MLNDSKNSLTYGLEYLKFDIFSYLASTLMHKSKFFVDKVKFYFQTALLGLIVISTPLGSLTKTFECLGVEQCNVIMVDSFQLLQYKHYRVLSQFCQYM